MKRATVLAITGMIFLQAPAYAEEVQRQEDLPPQPEFVPAGTADVWTFYCPAGGSAEIKVDAISMAANGKSPLNPAALIFRGGTMLAVGDEEVACSATLDCANQCVDVTVGCTTAGEHNILVFNKSGGTTCGKATGTYELSVTVFDGPNETGNELSATQVALGGQPAKRILGGAVRFSAGPAEDDVYWDGLFPLTPPAAAKTGAERSSRAPAINYYEN